MTWFSYALICVFGWGFADLFYKKGTDESDRWSHLKIAVWVGIALGLCAIVLIPFSESSMNAAAVAVKAARYLPASLSYIVSMVIGYAGLRYLELSIVSPVQNASGALSMVLMLIWFALTGRTAGDLAPLDLAGTTLIVPGMIALAVVEQRQSGAEALPKDKKYVTGALALAFPLLYCLFDTIGTAADGVILQSESGLGEIDVMILYGLTFLLAGIGCEIFMRVRGGKWYNPFAKREWPKAVAALCETFGQVFYVYAMAAQPVLTAPMAASYCILSVLLSRLLLKEKLSRAQYICVGCVIAGIVLLGVSEGIVA